MRRLLQSDTENGRCGYTGAVFHWDALVCHKGFHQPGWLHPVNSRRRFKQRELTCGFAVLGLTQVAQGTFVVAEVIEGDACPVHGLKVVPLMA